MVGEQRLQIRSKDERHVAAEERANAEIKPFNVEIDPADGHAITLVGVRILWGGRSDGANIRALRLNLDAVATWWLAGGQEFKGGTGAFFLGVAVPFDISS